MRLALALVLVLLGAGPGLAQQAYPQRAVTIVVPTSPGTGPDILGRTFAAKLAERWGSGVIVDNRAGAGSIVGSEYAARAPGDGHTLLLAPTSFVLQPAVQKVTGYDVFTSFAPVCLLATGAMAFAISNNTAARNVAELVALAKSQPGKLNYASPGVGTPQHLAMELFKSAAGVEIVHIPYKDNASAIRELAGGFVNAFISPVYTVAPIIRSGSARAIANVGSKRSAVFPDAPTLGEQGYPGVEAGVWVGLMTPASTPAPIVARLNSDVNAVLGLREVQAVLEKQGFVPEGGASARFAELIKADFARWSKAAAAAKIEAK